MRATCVPRARSNSTQIAVPSVSIGNRMTAIQKVRSNRRARAEVDDREHRRRKRDGARVERDEQD